MKQRLAHHLSRIGDFGLFAPVLALLAGLAVPPLAQLGAAVLIPCVVVLLAMSMGLAEAGRIERREWPPLLLLAACNLVGTPLLMHAVALSFDLGDVGGWVVLVAGCPAAGGAALVASLLRLPVRPLLLAQLLCFFALPLTAPLIAEFVLEGVVVSPAALFLRVLLMVGVPALLGYGLRRHLGEQRRLMLVRPLRGLGVLALCGIALSVACGLQRVDVTAPVWGDALLGVILASVLGATLGLLAAAASASGLLGGFALGGAVRNVSLLWSATLGLAPPEGELVMMLGTLWTLLLPALLGLVNWQRNRRALPIALSSRSTSQGRQYGMVTPQFRGDYRNRGDGTRGAIPRHQRHHPGGFAPLKAAFIDEAPLSARDGSSPHESIPMAVPPGLGLDPLPAARRATQALGRGDL